MRYEARSGQMGGFDGLVMMRNEAYPLDEEAQPVARTARWAFSFALAGSVSLCGGQRAGP